MQTDIGPVCRLQLRFMKWADEILLSALSQLTPERINQDLGNSFKSMLDTLGHIYLAEHVWLRRVQGEPNAKIADVESPADLKALGQQLSAMHQGWIAWADSLSDEQLLESVTYRNNQGGESQTPYWQIVLHLVNHGSYHRGQLATMLRQSGITPPGTDLITFYRTRQ